MAGIIPPSASLFRFPLYRFPKVYWTPAVTKDE
jgi:hypothetical protein